MIGNGLTCSTASKWDGVAKASVASAMPQSIAAEKSMS